MEDRNASADVLDHISDRVAQNQTDHHDYIGPDGFKKCGICHGRKEAAYEFMGKKRIVNCTC